MTEKKTERQRISLDDLFMENEPDGSDETVKTFESVHEPEPEVSLEPEVSPEPEASPEPEQEPVSDATIPLPTLGAHDFFTEPERENVRSAWGEEEADGSDTEEESESSEQKPAAYHLNQEMDEADDRAVLADMKRRRRRSEEKKESEEKERGGVFGFFYNWVLPIAVALVLAFLIRTYVGGATTVQGTSMEPTLHDGNVLLVSKIPTYLGKVKRGDVVIIDAPDQVKLYVKRLIGLPGETVEIHDGKVFINGQWLKDTWTDADTVTYYDSSWKLGSDEYFVLGDNRKEGASNDSRLFGPIKGDAIEGVARLRIWPISQFQSMY